MHHLQVLALVPMAMAAPAAHFNFPQNPSYSVPAFSETTKTVAIATTVVAGTTFTYTITYPVEPTPSKPSLSFPAGPPSMSTPSPPSTPLLPTSKPGTTTPIIPITATPITPTGPSLTPSSLPLSTPSGDPISKPTGPGSAPTISATACIASSAPVPTSISGPTCSKVIPDALAAFVSSLLQQLGPNNGLTQDIQAVLASLANTLSTYCPPSSPSSIKTGLPPVTSPSTPVVSPSLSTPSISIPTGGPNTSGHPTMSVPSVSTPVISIPGLPTGSPSKTLPTGQNPPKATATASASISV